MKSNNSDIVLFLLVGGIVGTLTASHGESQHGSYNVDLDQFNALLKRVELLESAVKKHPSDLLALEQAMENKFNDKMSTIQNHYDAILMEQKTRFRKQINAMKREIWKLSTKESEPLVQFPDSKSQAGDDDGNFSRKDRRIVRKAKCNAVITVSNSSGSTFATVFRSIAQRIRRYENEVGSIGFFATRATNLPHQGQHQAVVFDRIVTNVGGAYNSIDGEFTAPVTGLYIFSTTVVTHGNENTRYGFHMNGRWLSTIRVIGSASTYDDGGQTIVLRLAKGDIVMVGHIDSDHTLQGGNVSTFSGALVSQIYPDSTPIIGK